MTVELPKIDLSARVVYFPVRHHSPACAWHVRKLIREMKPDAVLIEGPRDATGLIPLLAGQAIRCPVAIYTTYVERVPDAPPQRHAAYYPMCDYSPELVALRTAAEIGAKAQFIDLTFAEMVHAGRRGEPGKAGSLLAEHHLRQSRFLQAACDRAGARDPDDLWDCLYEVNYEAVETERFMREVLGYCALSRMSSAQEALEAGGTLAREQAMAHAIAQQKGHVLVVTGGFHSVALPTTKPGLPEPLKLAKDDALVLPMRYGFEQLDRLNGYASGMPSPEFYQRRWEDKDPAGIIVDLGRLCRKRRHEISVADEIAALSQCRNLASLRQHARPSREDVLDGIRSTFVKGSADAEGLMVLAMARQLLAGDRVGDLPSGAGEAPLVVDFRETATRLRLDLDRIEAREVSLDLYRKTGHRLISRFFHRLRFLDVPFAKCVAGPDFVNGTDLERILEVWNYHWSPACESALIEKSLYGATLQEAALGLLMEQFGAAEQAGQGRSAGRATALLLDACRMGLHEQTPELLQRTSAMVAEDASFVSLVAAIESLMVLHVAREPLEAHRLTGVAELAGQAYDRSCYLIPRLAATAENEESVAIDGLNSLLQAVRTLGDSPARQQLRWDRLRELAATNPGNPALHGAACGLLYGEGQLDTAGLTTSLRGHLFSARGEGAEGAAFLRGLLHTARSVLWQVPEVIQSVHEVLKDWPEEQFIRQLPVLRLAFAGLTPRETDKVAKEVAGYAGVESFRPAASSSFSAGDMVYAAELNARVVAALKRDGLGELEAVR